MVFYRKYRPQTISELDSPALQETLKAVLSQKEIPHAFLFTGPKGLGKTSTARIIAKVLNCTGSNRNGIEPCDVCDQCVSIKNGTNIDVLEIDGASNRGIDEIRDLREKVNLAPSAAKKKVYIIDEVHMLTTEAFNALLKTIEEPPSHVVFIFATTEPQKVPATIISRCFHITLRKATDDEIVHALERIANGESLKFKSDEEKKEILYSIAKSADGGFRDAVKQLEEYAAFANGGEITKELIDERSRVFTQILGSISFLLDLKLKKQKEVLKTIEDMVNMGVDMKNFIQTILSNLHENLLYNVGLKEDSLIPLDKQFSIEEIQELVPLFSKAYQETKYAVVPSLPLELAVVEFCQSSSNVIASEEKQSHKNEEVATSQAPRNDSRMTVKDARREEQNIKVKQVLSGTKPTAPAKPTVEHTQENLPKDVKDNAILLENLIYKVKPYNHSVAGVLRSCIVQSVTDEKIVFETAYAFHKERLDDPKSKEILEKGLKEITGKNFTVSIALKGK